MNPIITPTPNEDKNTVTTTTPANGNVATAETPANTNTQAFPFPTSESMAKARGEVLPTTSVGPAAKKPLHERKRLTAVFNFAAGAAVTAGAKIGTTMLLTSFAVPAVATLIVASLAVGVASTALTHALENKTLKKQGLSTQKFWSAEKRNKNLKTFLTSSGFALLGGALVLGFTEGVFDKLFGSTPAPAESLAALPVAAPVATATEKFAGLIASTDVAVDVKQALARSASENAVAAAQGTKDLGYYAFNGLHGVPQDQSLAVELFHKAADAGNLQAKVDLAYIQYHGLAGVPADKAAALAAMKDIPLAKAASFVEKWGDVAKVATKVAALKLGA